MSAEAPVAEPEEGVSLSAHPRASRQIRQFKGWAGLAGFLVLAALSLQAGLTALEAGLRALAGGAVLYLLAWWLALQVWRQLASAEMHAARAAASGAGTGPAAQTERGAA